MLTIAIKGGRVKGYNRNIFIRNYGESNALSAYPTGESVVVNYRNGLSKEYRIKDGIHLRTL